jgi:hypothetical protein
MFLDLSPHVDLVEVFFAHPHRHRLKAELDEASAVR